MNSEEIQSPGTSILIPVFNREDFIGDCIQSALRQTLSNIEVVVVDNASTDNTWAICQRLAERDRRVRVFRNEKNVGPVRNWLLCAAYARGRYAKILWSDDLIHPTFLETLSPYLADPEVGFVYSAVSAFSEGDDSDTQLSFTSLNTGTYTTSLFIKNCLLDDHLVPVSPGCALFRLADLRKNLLLNIPNKLDSDFSMHAIGNDLLLFLLTAREYKRFAVVNKALSSFRMHKGSITIASARGNVPLHYDMAKAYFAEKYLEDSALLKKFNTNLLLDLIRYRSEARKIGINSISDYFSNRRDHAIDAFYLLMRIGRHLLWRAGVL